MALALRGAVSTDSTVGTLTLAKPAGVVSGDLLIILWESADSQTGAGAVGPTGFTRWANKDDATGGQFPAVWYRIADGTEGASFTCTEQFTHTQTGILFAVSGADVSGIPLENAVWFQNNVSSTNPFVAPATTCTTTGSWVIAWFDDVLSGASVTTPPTGFTSVSTFTVAAATTSAVYRNSATAGAIASASLTWSASTIGHAAQFVIKTAPLGPTITQQPTNTTAVAGSGGTFTVAATASAGSLTYQWQDNSSGSFANVSGGTGATSASYTTATTNALFQGRLYQCVVTDSNGSVTTTTARLAVQGFPVILRDLSVQTGFNVRLYDTTSVSGGGGGTTFTLSPGGTVVFSGSVAQIRTKIQLPTGLITFSGSAANIRTRTTVPSGLVTFSGTSLQLHTRVTPPSGLVTFSGSAGQFHTKALTASGTLQFSGAVSTQRTKIVAPSGLITFSGTTPNVRTRIQIPSGTLVFSGTAGITFTAGGGGGTTFTLSPGGTITFSGTSPNLRTRLQTTSGLVTYSGTAAYTRTKLQTPSGTLVFSGTSPEIKTRLQTVSGTLVFSSTAPISFSKSYTLAVGGTILFTGIAAYVRERIQIPTGTVIFNNTAPQIRTKVLSPTGNVTFTATNSLIFTTAGGSTVSTRIPLTFAGNS